jgi:hypothetical protein
MYTCNYVNKFKTDGDVGALDDSSKFLFLPPGPLLHSLSSSLSPSLPPLSFIHMHTLNYIQTYIHVHTCTSCSPAVPTVETSCPVCRESRRGRLVEPGSGQTCWQRDSWSWRGWWETASDNVGWPSGSEGIGTLGEGGWVQMCVCVWGVERVKYECMFHCF